MARVLDCGLEKSEFEFKSNYNLQFRTNTLGKCMNPFISLIYGLNTIVVLLQGLLWHWITHDSWYAIKHRNQTKPYGRAKIQTFTIMWSTNGKVSDFSFAAYVDLWFCRDFFRFKSSTHNYGKQISIWQLLVTLVFTGCSIFFRPADGS